MQHNFSLEKNHHHIGTYKTERKIIQPLILPYGCPVDKILKLYYYYFSTLQHTESQVNWVNGNFYDFINEIFNFLFWEIFIILFQISIRYHLKTSQISL